MLREKRKNEAKRLWKRRNAYHSILTEKWKEAYASVLPITLIVLSLCFLWVPAPVSAMLGFLVGAVMLIVGMGFFTLGTDLAMTPIGEHVGSAMTRSKKLWLIMLISFLVGVIITISEPDLQVLAEQVPGVPNMTLILAVALGVGIFLVVALLRILLRIPMKWLLLGCYALVFGLSSFVPDAFLAVAFDSGGVTTGPMTVPFILALGVGVSAIRSDANAENDSFGLVALCSVGPILAVMLLGLIFQPDGGNHGASAALPDAADTRAMTAMFMHSFPHYMKEVAVALLPIAAFFVLFQIFVLHLKQREVFRIVMGLVYTYFGLALFLTGVNVGFMPMGNFLGQALGSLNVRWLLVPIGMLIGHQSLRRKQILWYVHCRRKGNGHDPDRRQPEDRHHARHHGQGWCEQPRAYRDVHPAGGKRGWPAQRDDRCRRDRRITIAFPSTRFRIAEAGLFLLWIGTIQQGFDVPLPKSLYTYTKTSRGDPIWQICGCGFPTAY